MHGRQELPSERCDSKQKSSRQERSEERNDLEEQPDGAREDEIPSRASWKGGRKIQKARSPRKRRKYRFKESKPEIACLDFEGCVLRLKKNFAARVILTTIMRDLHLCQDA